MLAYSQIVINGPWIYLGWKLENTFLPYEVCMKSFKRFQDDRSCSVCCLEQQATYLMILIVLSIASCVWEINIWSTFMWFHAKNKLLKKIKESVRSTRIKFWVIYQNKAQKMRLKSHSFRCHVSKCPHIGDIHSHWWEIDNNRVLFI